jgi:hypothetical protein
LCKSKSTTSFFVFLSDRFGIIFLLLKGGLQMKEIKVSNIDYEAEIKKCKTLEDVTGKNGLLQRLFKDVMQQLLEAEMEETIGLGKYERNSECYEDEEKNCGWIVEKNGI